jgi:biotin carboxylase
MTKLSAVVVVDPISSACYYGAEIQKHGYLSIALISVKRLSEAVRRLQNLNEFESIVYADDLDEAMQALSRYSIRAVIPGSDVGIKFSDALSSMYGLLGNPVESSQARLNKLELKEKLIAAGVSATWARGVRLEELKIDTFKKNDYPLVVKPAQGTGSRNVKVCRNHRELYAAVQAVEKDREIQSDGEFYTLVEKYLAGDEYFVVTANCGLSGHKVMLCFAKYEKVEADGNPSIYKNIRSLSLNDSRALLAFSYASEVNSALEFFWGINDIELKIGSNGPLIIEQNGRLPGANVPRLIEACSGVNCYELNIDVYLGGFSRAFESVEFSRHFCICCLICNVSGVVKNISGLEKVEGLDSFYMLELSVVEGEIVGRTRDFLSSWGMVYLVHESQEVLARDSDFVHKTLALICD